jgi:hypothetical protein
LRREAIATNLEEITKEKQWISEALVRVDAHRQKLAGQLAELEATERVFARYSKGRFPATASPVIATVRIRLTAGGKRIRTAGPTCDRDADSIGKRDW